MPHAVEQLLALTLDLPQRLFEVLNNAAADRAYIEYMLFLTTQTLFVQPRRCSYNPDVVRTTQTLFVQPT